jgi:hypothetical protein
MARRQSPLGFASLAVMGLGALAVVCLAYFRIGDLRDDKDASSGAPSCATDWMMCRDNADLVNNSSKTGDARRACIDAVDKAAQHGAPKWCSGWLCEDFANYLTGTNAPDDGLITLIDNHLQMQNGLGVWVPSIVYCTYNIKAEKVVSLNIGAN